MVKISHPLKPFSVTDKRKIMQDFENNFNATFQDGLRDQKKRDSVDFVTVVVSTLITSGMRSSGTELAENRGFVYETVRREGILSNR